MENNNKSERLAGIISSLDALFNDSCGDLKGANEDFIKKGLEDAKKQFKGNPHLEEAVNMFKNNIK